jgi:hypothetical protein
MIILPASLGLGSPKSVAWTPLLGFGTRLFLWVKSDDAANTYTSGNTYYGTLKDSSSYNRSVSTSTANVMTKSTGINGRQTVRCETGYTGFSISGGTGTNFNLLMTDINGAMVGAVWNRDPDTVGASSHTIFAQETNTAGYTRVGLNAAVSGGTNTPRMGGRNTQTGTYGSVTSGAVKNSATVGVGKLDLIAQTANLEVDGTMYTASGLYGGSGTVGFTAAQSTLLMFPGNNDLFRGDFGECIIVSGPVTTDELQKTSGYLAWQWGLQGSLDAAHPYKSAPPTV